MLDLIRGLTSYLILKIYFIVDSICHFLFGWETYQASKRYYRWVYNLASYVSAYDLPEYHDVE